MKTKSRISHKHELNNSNLIREFLPRKTMENQYQLRIDNLLPNNKILYPKWINCTYGKVIMRIVIDDYKYIYKLCYPNWRRGIIIDFDKNIMYMHDSAYCRRSYQQYSAGITNLRGIYNTQIDLNPDDTKKLLEEILNELNILQIKLPNNNIF